MILSLVSFLGFPIFGLRNGGWAGFLLSGVAGSFLGTIATIVTIVSSTFNFALGVLSTPASILATFLGKTWDCDRKKYMHYVLEEDAVELARELESRGLSREVKNKDFYDRLGIEPSASKNEIKKAFRQKAKYVHPDKNPDDEEAQTEFLRLHEAYQTLSDDKLRADYDQFGATASRNKSFDASVFFSVLWDADSVETYIGELRISFYVDRLQVLIELSQSDADMESFAAFLDGWNNGSRRRHVDIATGLLRFLSDFETEHTSKEQFAFTCQKEAEKIAQSAFGNRFLKMIGKAILLESEKFVSYSSPFTFPQGVYTSSRQYLGRVLNNWRSMRKMFTMVGAVMSTENTRTHDGHITWDPDFIKSLLPDMLEVVWGYIISDVSWTLHVACGKLLADSVGRERRQRRAEGLQLLGQAMLAVAEETSVNEQLSSGIIKKRIDRAFDLAMMKAA